MESKNMIGGIVSLAVVVICVAAIMMPVLSDATQTHETFTNEGIYYMANPTDSMSVTFDGTDWTIDGETLEYTAYGSSNIIVTDTLFVRNNGQVRGSASATWADANLTIDDGTITGTATISGTSTAINYTYEYVYVATNETSENVMKLPTQGAYINEDSTIIGKGLTSVKDSDGNSNSTVFYVDVSDLTATVTSTNNTITISDVVVNYTEVDGYNDLYLFSSVTFNVTWGDYVTACTYSYVIVPTEVTAELSQHLDSGEIALLNAIPALVIVAIVIAALGIAITSRRD